MTTGPQVVDTPVPSTRRLNRLERVALIVAALTGVAMLVIGLRFLLSPRAASHFFGLGRDPAVQGLLSAIGLRDLWVGGLVIAFAWCREWRALALWFGLGALVCFGDGIVVASASGPRSAVAFHVGAGVICVLVALIAARRAKTAAR